MVMDYGLVSGFFWLFLVALLALDIIVVYAVHRRPALQSTRAADRGPGRTDAATPWPQVPTRNLPPEPPSREQDRAA